ncbi:hypothetical protein TNCT_675841 [Trichonephila clavata]|uniref:Uncharacterized protein n=1 Tax=Trichonephila clavata TaxID=2740835 RepID=A0A8X6LCJ6_TRICU|nr:hypothetical protein TNCT_92941 [Trichonephila clavata]GFR04735.1 hypothetical protein TNCT_675841 [Trichonephila clavata]
MSLARALDIVPLTRRKELKHGTTVRQRNERSSHHRDLTERMRVDYPACFTKQGRWVQSALPNPSTLRERPCVGGRSGRPTHLRDPTEGPYVTYPCASRRKYP